MGHFLKSKISVIKTFCRYLQDGMPIKLVAVHVFNVVPFIKFGIATIKPLVSDQILNKVRKIIHNLINLNLLITSF